MHNLTTKKRGLLLVCSKKPTYRMLLANLYMCSTDTRQTSSEAMKPSVIVSKQQFTHSVLLL